MSDKLWEAGGRDIPDAEVKKLQRRGRALGRFMRLYGTTWRLREENREGVEALRPSCPHGAVIYAIPHSRLSMLAYSHRDRHPQVLISSSRDGIFMTAIAQAMGLGTVAGSSSRGGAAALREMVRRSARGLDIAITVDGPRGPRGRVKPGILALAAMTGAPVLPVSAAAAPRKIFRSWDKTVLPLPFSRVLVRHGEPLWLARDADEAGRDAFRLEIERALQTLTDDLDRRLSAEPIPPDEESDG